MKQAKEFNVKNVIVTDLDSNDMSDPDTNNY